MNLKGLVTILLAVTTGSAGFAQADRGRRHEWHRPPAGIILSPYWGPWVYPHYPIYNSPLIIERVQPPVYIEQGTPPPASAPTHYWYYCETSGVYYPYVSECRGDWRKVMPTPPDLPPESR